MIYISDNIIPHEKKAGYMFLTRLGIRFVDGFIVQSKCVREDLLSLRPDARYADVPHPLYTIFPRAISQSEARKKLGIRESKVILYFGFIRAYKGVNFLIQAIPEILKTHQIRCLICGEFYEGREETLKLIKDLNLESSVTAYDQFISNETVHHYFCAADLVVLPYVTATQSGVVQVAYNYNRPVIVTRVGGLPEVVVHGRTGYVIPAENPEAIAETVNRFYTDRGNVAFEKHIESEKKKYSWERLGEAIAALAEK